MLDHVQDTFLDEVGATTKSALLDFYLAPLIARRDIAMLSLLHRTQIGTALARIRNFSRLLRMRCMIIV